MKRIDIPVTKLVGLLLIVLFSTGCSIFGVRTTEEAAYAVLKSSENIEVRRYDSVMAVQTYVEANDFEAATGIAFNRLFDYITGDNKASQDIAMTAPVIVSQGPVITGLKASRSLPIMAKNRSDSRGWFLLFVLPEDVTRDDAPQPDQAEVELISLPEKVVVAYRYTGLWSDTKFAKHSQTLLDWVKQENYQAISEPYYAGYDPPWTLPFLRRNEVLIDVSVD